MLWMLLACGQPLPPTSADGLDLWVTSTDHPTLDETLFAASRDQDADGVPAAEDCDDEDDAVGALLYEADLHEDDGSLQVGPVLTDPWLYAEDAVSNVEGGQQALLGVEGSWEDTVTIARLWADGAEASGEATTRFRAGVLARARVDEDPDEGFVGYRCAVARNAPDDAWPEGAFVQLAAFLDTTEDGLHTEGEDRGAENPGFDQLARVERSEASDVLGGDPVELRFRVSGDTLRCTFRGEDGEEVSAEASDTRFGAGQTGLSVLNALSSYESLRVCEAK